MFVIALLLQLLGCGVDILDGMKLVWLGAKTLLFIC